MRSRRKVFRTWLLLVFVLGLSVSTAYAFVQQNGRSSINTPLIQKVQSVEADLKAGISTEKILASSEIDLSKNMNPFITLYSPDEKVIGSSSHLDGKELTLPIGILNRARVEGEVRVTWQPTAHLRFASVTEYVPSVGFISVSQSLREVENRATQNFWIGLASVVIGSVFLGIGVILFGAAG